MNPVAHRSSKTQSLLCVLTSRSLNGERIYFTRSKVLGCNQATSLSIRECNRKAAIAEKFLDFGSVRGHRTRVIANRNCNFAPKKSASLEMHLKPKKQRNQLTVQVTEDRTSIDPSRLPSKWPSTLPW